MHIDVEYAELQLENNTPWWNLHQLITPDDGREPYWWSHFFPHDIFEWRVAEYDLPADDMDTLLDVVLYEPYLAEDFEMVPINAPSIKAARQHHLTRVKAVKGPGRLRGIAGRSTRTVPMAERPRQSVVLLDSAEEDPLEVIKRESPMSAPHIEVKRQMIDYHRESARREKALRAPLAPAGWQRETADELRSRIMPKRGARTHG
jgi:hypothetical protein